MKPIFSTKVHIGGYDDRGEKVVFLCSYRPGNNSFFWVEPRRSARASCVSCLRAKSAGKKIRKGDKK